MTPGTRNANVAASVRQRLLNLARSRNEEFEQMLVRYALERLLYRIGRSDHAEQFVLKGALLFQIWFDLPQRPTRDADFLGFGNAEPDELAAVFRELAAMQGDDLAADALTFRSATVAAQPIRKEAGYPGVRVTMTAELAGALIPVQCDVGFGDAVTPAAMHQEFPTLLQLPAPRLRAYPPETVVAEKLEALVKLAAFNTRMKDYFDLWVLFGSNMLDEALLVSAVRATFARRQTDLPKTLPTGLGDTFVVEKSRMWQSFLDRQRLTAPPLAEVVHFLSARCWPLLNAAADTRL